MNLPDNLLPQPWYWLADCLFALVLVRAILAAPWKRLVDNEQMHYWLGTCVGLMLMWCFVKAGIKPGLTFHILGATLLTLTFGPYLAIVGLSLVALGATLFGFGGWAGFSANALIMGALPAVVSYGIFRLVDRWLPNNFFVYIFLNSFVGAGASMGATGLAVTGLMAVAGAYPLSYLVSQYLPYYILMAWSEAMLTGMIVTILVVYRPRLVMTFDDARYIRNK